MRAKSFSPDSVALCTSAHQAPLSWNSLGKNTGEGLPCPPPGDLTDPGIWGCDAGLGMVGVLGPPLVLLASDNSEPALYGHNRCLNHDLSPKLQLAQNNPCT